MKFEVLIVIYICNNSLYVKLTFVYGFLMLCGSAKNPGEYVSALFIM